MAVKEGWRGRFFEDFEVGDVYEHPLGRTVTTTDNAWFTLLTQNTAPIHFDHYYASQTEFGKPLVNSVFTFGLMVGVSVADTTLGTLVANLGYDEVTFPAPVFVGDTLRTETTIAALRESKSRPNAGIVTFEHKSFNQRGELVARCLRTALLAKTPSIVPPA